MTMTIDEILGDFGSLGSDKTGTKDSRPITIWLPADAKARYDKLQEKSGRKFSKKARETLLALIEIAEARTA